MPIVYLIQPAEYIGTSCYKIGLSRQHGIARMNAYQKGTRYICIHETEYPCMLEKRIIDRFNEMFELACGKEYFRGDEMQMYDEFEALCRDMKCNPPTSHDGDACGSNVHSHTIVRGRGGADIREFFPNNVALVSSQSIDEKREITACFRKPANRKYGTYKCDYCEKIFNRADTFNRHLNKKIPCHTSHPSYKPPSLCRYCNKPVFEGKTKNQIWRHTSYCKKQYNNVTYHEREQLRKDEYESNEIKLLRKEMNQVKAMFKQIIGT